MSKHPMSKREALEMGTVGTIGTAGIALPSLESTADFFVGITPIVSFFIIVIPTGIWAWYRVFKIIKETKEDKE